MHPQGQGGGNGGKVSPIGGMVSLVRIRQKSLLKKKKRKENPLLTDLTMARLEKELMVSQDRAFRGRQEPRHAAGSHVRVLTVHCQCCGRLLASTHAGILPGIPDFHGMDQQLRCSTFLSQSIFFTGFEHFVFLFPLHRGSLGELAL